MSSYVREDECDEMRRLAEDDVSYRQIGDVFGRSAETVSRHVNNRCQHSRNDNQVNYDPERLAEVIHEVAADIGRIPSKMDWKAQSGRCSHNTILRIFGVSTWQEAMAAAGLPALPERAPEPIRRAAYQKPELCTHPNDD